MKTDSTRRSWSSWSVVVLFAVAMAWVESAVVYYLRTHIDRIVPYQPDPLPIIGGGVAGGVGADDDGGAEQVALVGLAVDRVGEADLGVVARRRVVAQGSRVASDVPGRS